MDPALEPRRRKSKFKLNYHDGPQEKKQKNDQNHTYVKYSSTSDGGVQVAQSSVRGQAAPHDNNKSHSAREGEAPASNDEIHRCDDPGREEGATGSGDDANWVDDEPSVDSGYLEFISQSASDERGKRERPKGVSLRPRFESLL